MTEWLCLACTRSVVRRALRYAVGVGTLLIVINHGDAIMRRDVSITGLFRMGLTVTVPYMVSTASAVGALRERHRADSVQQIRDAALFAATEDRAYLADRAQHRGRDQR